MQVTSILENAVQVQDSTGKTFQIPFQNLHAEHELIKAMGAQAIFQLAYILGYRQSMALAA